MGWHGYESRNHNGCFNCNSYQHNNNAERLFRNIARKNNANENFRRKPPANTTKTCASRFLPRFPVPFKNKRRSCVGRHNYGRIPIQQSGARLPNTTRSTTIPNGSCNGKHNNTLHPSNPNVRKHSPTRKTSSQKILTQPKKVFRNFRKTFFG